jgi:ATP-dependent RNA helicase DDX55/SPB4
LARNPTDKVIVFFLTCACVDYFASVLPKLNALKSVRFLAIHGKMSTKKRVGERSSWPCIAFVPAD